MKRKDFVMYGEREGVVMKVIDDGKKGIWQDMSVMIMDTGMTTTNHPLVLDASENLSS